MRDYAEETRLEAPAEEPRGRAALGLSPKGMFYDWVVQPMGGRGWTLAAKATERALVVCAGVALVAAVWALTR